MNQNSPNFKSDFSLLQRFGRKFFGTTIAEKYYSSFYKDVSYPQATKGNILMYVGIGHMYLTPTEILIYHLLRKSGFNVDYCIYGEDIEINEVITKDRVEKVGKDRFWNGLMRNAKNVLKASSVEYQFIQEREIVRQTMHDLEGQSLDSILNFELDGIHFGNIVEGVMYRYYKSLTFGVDAIEVAMKFMRTSLTNYMYIKQKLKEKNYKYVMFSHGIYCTWQPVVEYLEQIGQNYICYDRAKTKGHCNINLNKPSPVWDIDACWKRMAHYNLNHTELNQVDTYLKERELQKGDVYAYNFTEKSKDLAALKEKMGIKANSKVVTIFTNLIWDAANVSRDIAFDSPLDCIKQTITKYANQEGVHILVRPHPAEQVLGTKERYDELIKEAFNNKLPDNVTVIEHEWKVNSFSVLEITDIGIVHTSTVGLELAIEGKATLLISETHYRNKGFTYDAESSSHFFNLLENLLKEKMVIENQVELAKKYFYIMMFEYQHKMPGRFTPKGLFDGYGYNLFEDLSANADESVNKIINRIAQEKPITDFILR